jgi:hypothetical protein
MYRIIVGVKYCFRYNARNRALARGEDGEPINLENMPRPHRRRREKKLMTMDEVNERFPLTKYKAWVAARASEGLPTAGGVAAVSPNRAASIKHDDSALPSSPVDTKHSADRPGTAASAREISEVTVSSPTSAMGGTFGEGRKGTEGAEKATAAERAHMPPLAEVNTTATADADKAEDEEEEEEDHIHDALPPELLTTPGDSCAICIDTIEEDDDIRGLTCGHAFHASCLDPWLTSRRACCPLCKADYYVPKPRPDGEAAEAERPRRNGRMAMPAPPGSAWSGIRGNRGMMFPGRGFMSSPVYGDGLHVREWSQRRAQEARRSSQAQASEPIPADNAASTRLLYANPFRGLHFPRRNRTSGNSNNQPAVVPAPAQLEEVVVR